MRLQILVESSEKITVCFLRVYCIHLHFYYCTVLQYYLFFVLCFIRCELFQISEAIAVFGIYGKNIVKYLCLSGKRH